MTGRFPQLTWKRALTRCAVIALVVGAVRPSIADDAPDSDELLQQPVRISGDIAHQWRTANGVQVSLVRGNCRIEQEPSSYSARQMVVWQSVLSGRHQIDVYFEGDVSIQKPGSTRNQPSHYVKLWSQVGTTYQARWPREYSAPISDALLERAVVRRRKSDSPIRRTGLISLPPPGYQYASHRLGESTSPLRRVRFYARTGQSFSFKAERSTNTTPVEQIGIITGGIKLNVDTPQSDGSVDPDAVELAADNMVLWTDAADLTELMSGQEKIQTRDTRFQLYLEGHIVIRQGDQVLKADRAFYDATDDRALLLDAELKLYIPAAETHLRVRASRIRQITEGMFHAQQAWMSASYFGKPGYRLEANDIFLEPRVINPWVKAAGGWTDPESGRIDDGKMNWLTTLENRLVIGDTPVLYFPYLAGPAEEPHLPIKKVQVESDRIFGTQVKTVWDPFHLFGKESPESLSAGVLLDWLSRRGPAGGLEGAYDKDDLFGIGDQSTGDFHGYYVNDGSSDNLGLDRRSLVPRDENRGRVMWRHRHDFPYSISVFGEAGYVSDRNFLEQYYENEFDRQKNNETRVVVEQKIQNLSWSILGQPQVNGFENSTEWYPKGDLFLLGEPVFGSPVTWTMHTSAGMANLHGADVPSATSGDTFTPLPYYAGVDGGVFMSRHEVTAPFNVGPFILSPFLMGEAAFWNNDLLGNSRDRFVGSAGVRGSLSMSRIFPYVRNSIFNLNGLAHKMVFDAEYAYTDSTDNLTGIAQYNEFDDDAQERFRQRFRTNTFGGAFPAYLGARRYAVRSGAGSLVSVPWHELVDDLHVVRLGWRHRLQTKVGPPNDLRVRDWMTLDLDASWFPTSGRHSLAARDFNEDFGLLSARYQWLLSERTALLAGVLYDTFDGGQQLWNVGLLNQRNARGSLYLGVRQVKAQSLDSQIATASASYLMSHKWAGTASTAYDIAEGNNRAQSFTLTRIGADFLFHFGFSFDQSKDSLGVALALEPRFGPRTAYSSQMNSLLGLDQF